MCCTYILLRTLSSAPLRFFFTWQTSQILSHEDILTRTCHVLQQPMYRCNTKATASVRNRNAMNSTAEMHQTIQSVQILEWRSLYGKGHIAGYPTHVCGKHIDYTFDWGKYACFLSLQHETQTMMSLKFLWLLAYTSGAARANAARGQP